MTYSPRTLVSYLWPGKSHGQWSVHIPAQLDAFCHLKSPSFGVPLPYTWHLLLRPGVSYLIVPWDATSAWKTGQAVVASETYSGGWPTSIIASKTRKEAEVCPTFLGSGLDRPRRTQSIPYVEFVSIFLRETRLRKLCHWLAFSETVNKNILSMGDHKHAENQVTLAVWDYNIAFDIGPKVMEFRVGKRAEKP